MYPRRGLFGGRGGVTGGFSQNPRGRGGRGGGGGGGGGAGSLLGSLGPRDGPGQSMSGYNRNQSMSGQGYYGMPYQRPHVSHGPPLLDSGFRGSGMMSMGMGKRSGGPDMSWESKRQRTDRTSDLGYNRRSGRGNDGNTEYDPSRPTEDAGQSMDRHMPSKRHQPDGMRRSGGNSTREYCSTCSRWIDGSFESHKNSREHQDKNRRKSSGPVTTKSTTNPTESNAKTDEKVTSDASEPTPAKEDVNSEETKKQNLDNEPPSSVDQTEEDTNGNVPADLEEEQEGSVEDEYAIPEYDEKVCFGREYVVPVSGFFCRLCHKFYSSETTAYDTHCHSRMHYDKYSATLEALRVKRNGDTNTSPNPPKQCRGRGARRGNSRA